MITRAILSLLKHNNRVNLPTLGAIIKQQDFSQSLFFNQFIKYDDGVLSAHLTKIEMLTEDESQAMMRCFIETIREGIHREGKFEIKELGVFCYVDNRLELLNEKEYARTLAISNAHALSETQENENTQDGNGEMPSLRDPEKADEKLIAIDAEEGDVGDEALASSLSTGYFETPIDFEMLEEVPQVPNQFSRPTKKLRNASRPLKFIRVVTPLIVVGLILVRVSLPIPGGPQTAAVIVDSTGLSPVDSISREPLTSVKSPSSPSTLVHGLSDATVVEPARKDEESGLMYHVIIGAFRFESNADKLVAEQRMRGHTVSKLGKRNGYYLVSYESTTNVWMAKKICKDIKAFYPEVWLDKQE